MDPVSPKSNDPESEHLFLYLNELSTVPFHTIEPLFLLGPPVSNIDLVGHRWMAYIVRGDRQLRAFLSLHKYKLQVTGTSKSYKLLVQVHVTAYHLPLQLFLSVFLIECLIKIRLFTDSF